MISFDENGEVDFYVGCQIHPVRKYLRLVDPDDFMSLRFTCEQCEFEKVNTRWGEEAEL